MTPPSPQAAPDVDALQDAALNLRESVNSSRARMSAQRDQLARLRAEVAALRSLVDQPVAPRPKPVLKEAAPISAVGTVSLKTGTRASGARLLPYAAILGVAVAFQLRPAPRRAAGVPVAAAASQAAVIAAPLAAPISVDDAADEALLLAHEWRMPGDDRALSDRLDPGVQPPGAPPAWNVERTGDRVYRVTFRADDASPAYDFDVDLAARRVDPTPDTAALMAPTLSAQR